MTNQNGVQSSERIREKSMSRSIAEVTKTHTEKQDCFLKPCHKEHLRWFQNRSPIAFIMHLIFTAGK